MGGDAGAVDSAGLGWCGGLLVVLALGEVGENGAERSWGLWWARVNRGQRCWPDG